MRTITEIVWVSDDGHVLRDRAMRDRVGDLAGRESVSIPTPDATTSRRYWREVRYFILPD